jgi:hypothetical protein
MIRDLQFSNYVLFIRSVGLILGSVKENSNECFLLYSARIIKHLVQVSIGRKKVADLYSVCRRHLSHSSEALWQLE